MKQQSTSAMQIEAYLKRFVKVIKRENQLYNINKVTINRPLKRRENLIVILMELSNQEKIMIPDELEIQINSDLYYNDHTLSAMLYKICLTLNKKIEPSIEVIDVPGKPYINVTIVSKQDEKMLSTQSLNLHKVLPDELICADKDEVYAYLDQVENNEVTLESYITKNGRFTSELQWLLSFKEFIIKTDIYSFMDIEFITNKNKHIYPYKTTEFDFNKGQIYVDIGCDILYPEPIPDSIQMYNLIRFISDEDLTLADIKNLAICILRNDENIWIKYKDDEHFNLRP